MQVTRVFQAKPKVSQRLMYGDRGIVLASFRNAEMERLYTLALGGNNTIVMNYEKRTLDEMLQEVQDADSD